MTPALRNQILEVLQGLPDSATLDEADTELARIKAISSDHCQALRWGLFEGWQSWRPESVLKEWPANMQKDYREARMVGMELSQRHLPR